MAETRRRRAPERLREERGRRFGWWTLLDSLGRRPWAGAWLDGLHATGVPILMLFAAGDDGIEYLRNRLARRSRRVTRDGAIAARELPDIDHSMHRVWRRGSVVDAISAYLESL